MMPTDAQPLILSPDRRPDFDAIVARVPPNARVLDLGCGNGDLMARLIEEKNAVCRGVDRHQPSITASISKGLSVFHGDIHDGLGDLPNDAFDYVILSRTLQQVTDPEVVIREMLRVGHHAIVSFPNFAYWPIRWHLLVHGTLPLTPALPYAWFNTPNIRLITITDFEEFCRNQGFVLLERIALCIGDGSRPRQIHLWPDWRGEVGIFVLGRKK